MPKKNLNILWINQQSEFRIPKQFIESSNMKIVQKLLRLKLLKSRQCSLNVNFVFLKPKQIKLLNKNFRSKDKATDILSFNSSDPEIIGELVFCPHVITKNAAFNNWPVKFEYLYMLIHGYLHLLGFDHESDQEAFIMFSLQDKIFNSISEGPKV